MVTKWWQKGNWWWQTRTKSLLVWRFCSNKPAQSVDFKESERKWKLLNLFCCFCYEHFISYVGLESKIYYFKGKLVPDYNVTSYWRVGHTHLQTYAGIISLSPSIILFHENWLHERDHFKCPWLNTHRKCLFKMITSLNISIKHADMIKRPLKFSCTCFFDDHMSAGPPWMQPFRIVELVIHKKYKKYVRRDSKVIITF